MRTCHCYMSVCVPGEDMIDEECRKTKQEALSYLDTTQVAYTESQNNSNIHKKPQKITFQSRVNSSSFQLIAEEAKKKKTKPKKQKTMHFHQAAIKKKKAISQECLSLLGVTKLRRIFEFSSSWRLKHHLI